MLLLLVVVACVAGQTTTPQQFTTPPVGPSFPRSFVMGLLGGATGVKLNISVLSDDASQSLMVHEEVRMPSGNATVTSLVHGGANASCSVQFGGRCSLVCQAGAACPLAPEGCSTCQFVDLLAQFGHDPAGDCSFQLQKGDLFNATISNAVQSFNTSLCFDSLHNRPIYLAGYGGQASFFLLVSHWEGGGNRVVPSIPSTCQCVGQAPRNAVAQSSFLMDLLSYHQK